MVHGLRHMLGNNAALNKMVMTEEDEENYMAIMAGFDAAMLALESRNPVPMCHFKAMTQHWDNSHLLPMMFDTSASITATLKTVPRRGQRSNLAKRQILQ